MGGHHIGPARTGLAAKVADPSYTLRRWLIPALLWLLMIAYKDVRLGRSTHLVDMANEHHRVTYTALSNTIIGVLLLAAAGFGAVAQGVGGTGAVRSDVAGRRRVGPGVGRSAAGRFQRKVDAGGPQAAEEARLYSAGRTEGGRCWA